MHCSAGVVAVRGWEWLAFRVSYCFFFAGLVQAGSCLLETRVGTDRSTRADWEPSFKWDGEE